MVINGMVSDGVISGYAIDLTFDAIMARKETARRELARLPFAEKILIVERMREGLAPFSAFRRRPRGNIASERRLKISATA